MISFNAEESEIEAAEGATMNAVFNFSAAVAMPTTVRYTLTPGTANADDYVAGSGEVIVPADATSEPSGSSSWTMNLSSIRVTDST